MPKQVIPIQEPDKLEEYMRGLNEGYMQGDYDAFESMYKLIKNHKVEGAKMLQDYLINKFEHGGH